MKKIFFIVLEVIVLIAIAWFIQFNIIQDDLSVENDVNTIPHWIKSENNLSDYWTIIMNETNPLDDTMLLVLSAPSIHNEYYKSAFQQIIDFQIAYAKQIMKHDNVVVVVDKDTKKYFDWKLPEEVLLIDELYDIRMRDPTTVNPYRPTQFQYTRASMTKKQSKEVQNRFNDFADYYGIKRTKSNLILDWWNVVDNYTDKAITTTRFLEDNNVTYEEAKEKLKHFLWVEEVAILEPDDELLAHSDGMVSWIGENTLLVNDYESTDPEFKELIMKELKESFPSTTIIEIPVKFKKNKPWEWEWFESAYGVNLNATYTKNAIYVPIFGMDHDKQALDIIRKNTDKIVVPVDAQWVCAMGWSVRCLTWQLAGENAKKLIEMAKNK